MANGDTYRFPLAALLAVLKRNGYEVSIEQILELQSVLLTSPVHKMSPDQLKYIIAPVLAGNGDEQKEIYHIVDSFIAAGRSATPKKLPLIQRWLQNRQLVFNVKLAAFILVVVTGTALFVWRQQSAKKTPLVTEETIKKLIPANDKTTNTLPEKPADNPKPGDPAAHNRVDRYSVTYSNRPIVARPRDNNLQIAAAFGLGLGAILYHLVFFERRKKMELKKKKSQDTESFLRNETGMRGNTAAQEEWDHMQIMFPEKDYLIRKTHEFTAIRSNLKKPAFIEHVDLDIRASSHATAKSAGFPTLVYGSDRRERKYLVLFENHDRDAYITRLLLFMMRFLESNKVPVTRFSYTDNIASLQDTSGKIVDLATLSYQFYDYHLLVIGRCASFYGPGQQTFGGELSEIFGRWKSKSVITPLSLADWSGQEKELQHKGFQVVPAELESITLLTRAISDEKTVKKEQLQEQLGDMYSVSGINFHSSTGLKEYLKNEQLFQLVCALAVYPRLNWSLTLTLFSGILNKKAGGNDSRLDYNMLLKIARIPWVRSGKLEETLRLQLLNSIDTETELAARETIMQLIDEVRPDTSRQSPAVRELDMQYKLNSFFLFAHDQHKYKKFADVKDEIMMYWDHLDEWALKERVRSKESGLMPRNKLGELKDIDEFILDERQIEKVNVTFLRVLLLTLPAFALYILFAVFRPGFLHVYGSYEPVSFGLVLNTEGVCDKKPTHIIVYKNKLDTFYLNGSSRIDYIPVQDVNYNREVLFWLFSKDSSLLNFTVNAVDSLSTVRISCEAGP